MKRVRDSLAAATEQTAKLIGRKPLTTLEADEVELELETEVRRSEAPAPEFHGRAAS